MTLFKGVFFYFFLISPAYSLYRFSADVGLDSRSFFSVENQILEEQNYTFNGNISLKMKKDIAKSVLEVYGQVDPLDEERNLIIPKDFWFALDNGTHILKAGYQIINWSSAEAFHPADVINSRSLDSNLQRPAKIGEPIISYKVLFGESSSFTLMYMPYFSDPIYASEYSAFGIGYEVESVEIYDSFNFVKEDNFVDQYAALFSTNFLGIDLSISYVNHIDRDFPLFFASSTKIVNGSPAPVFSALYFQKEQIGLTTQSVLANWLLKTELVFINWENEITTNPLYFKDDHSIFALGIERSTAFENGSQLTFILEHQYYLGINENYLSNIFFQNDLLLGLRIAFNDISSKELFFSIISDIEYGDQFFVNVNYSQRLFETWKIETGIHFVDSKTDTDHVGLEPIDRSDHVYLNLKKYF